MYVRYDFNKVQDQANSEYIFVAKPDFAGTYCEIERKNHFLLSFFSEPICAFLLFFFLNLSLAALIHF